MSHCIHTFTHIPTHILKFCERSDLPSLGTVQAVELTCSPPMVNLSPFTIPTRIRPIIEKKTKKVADPCFDPHLSSVGPPIAHEQFGMHPPHLMAQMRTTLKTSKQGLS